MLAPIYRLIIILFTCVGLYGFLLPYLISSKSDELVVTGFVVGLGSLPLLVQVTYNQIKKLVGSPTKNQKEK